MSSGGSIEVGSDGVSDHLTVLGGGSANVVGGTTFGTLLNSGAVEMVGAYDGGGEGLGQASGTVVSSGGFGGDHCTSGVATGTLVVVGGSQGL